MESLLDIFEQTVSRFPDKTAISCREEHYTFAELKEAARRLGKQIAHARTQPEPAPIGVMANRGADTGAFFLAILYSGNFYVPIDPDLPTEKMARIFADADFRAVLCAEEDRDTLREVGFEGAILTKADVDHPGQNDDARETAAGARECRDERSDGRARTVSSDTPAYMIYTSGSTGQPKGVLKSHGAVIDFMETYIRLFDLGPEEIIGNQTPFFFDA